jgi:arginine/serine-rich splicing factor 4/5/6
VVRYSDVLREGGPGSRSKGCGIVEFETREQAAAAIQLLNQAELHGRRIFVREDREDYETREGGREGGPPAGEPRGGGGLKRPRG